MRARGRARAALVATAIWAAPVAWAHPFGARFAAHQCGIHLAAERVRVTYAVEVPLGLLAVPKPGQPSSDASMARELLNGLRLNVDGVDVPLRSTAEVEVRANQDSRLFALALEAPLGPGEHRVQLVNGNLPDVPGWFAAAVTLAPAHRVRATPLLRAIGGRTIDDSGRWRMGDDFRTVEVAIEPRPRLAAWWLGAVDGRETRTLLESQPATVSEVLLGRRPSPAVPLVALAVGMLAGSAGAADDRRHRAAWCLAVAILAVVDRLVASPHLADIVAGAIVGGVLVATPRRVGPAAGIGAVAVGVGLHQPAAALGVAAVYLVSGELARVWPRGPVAERAGYRAAAGTAVAVAVLLLTRGVGGLAGS